jgi:hypothetical protein
MAADFIRTASVTIANGQALSTVADLRGLGQVITVIMPSTWTAAALTFQASIDGANFFDVRYNGAEVMDSAPPVSKWIAFDPAVFAAARYLKIRSGTSGTPVNQAAERTLTLAVRPL